MDQHKICCVDCPPLARALYAAVDFDMETPPGHDEAVAMIGYVMRLKRSYSWC